MRLWMVATLPVCAALVFNLGVYALRARFVRAQTVCDAPEPLAGSTAFHAWVGEWWATTLALLSVPVGYVLPRRLGSLEGRGTVVLVHGWGLNRGCFWWLARRLRREGWGPILFLDYRSLGADAAQGAAKLHRLLEQSVPAGRSPVALIGHSLGGLVIRYYLRRYPATRVRRVITLGTPHAGTELARYAAPGHPLAPNSELLRGLAAGDRLTQQFDTISIYSTFDALVLPASSALYPGAFNIQLTEIGHNALLFSDKVGQLVEENLDAPLR